jgi:hypothetical protein
VAQFLPPNLHCRSIPLEAYRGASGAIETFYAAVQITSGAAIKEKVRHGPADLLVTPDVGSFRTLDVFQASAILRAVGRRRLN